MSTTQIDLSQQAQSHSLTATQVAAGTLTNTEIAAAAAIAFSKLAALPSADILVGNGSNVATAVSVSGDVSLSNAGSATVNTVGTSSASNIHSAELAANAATDLAMANRIVKRDGTGSFAASVVTGNLTGNVTGNVSGSAASFTGSLSGDVTGTQSATVVAAVNGVTITGTPSAGQIIIATSSVAAHWAADTPFTQVFKETPSGTINGTNRYFQLASVPTSGTDLIFYNGSLQDNPTPSTSAGSQSLTFTNASPTVTTSNTSDFVSGDVIRSSNNDALGVISSVTTNTSFTLSANWDGATVTSVGTKLTDTGDYIIQGRDIAFDVAPSSSSKLRANYNH